VKINGRIFSGIIKRDLAWQMQTPIVFCFDLFSPAYRSLYAE
jgi:2-C-methyl-D-erythritol 4-phosphate cytidylyltransferase